MKQRKYAENALKPQKKEILLNILDIHQKAFVFIAVYSGLKGEIKAKLADNLT
jgi:hypothetical protein